MTESFNFTSIRLISDKYNGITIGNSSIPTDAIEFEKELISIFENINGKKLLWINLRIENSHIIPLLTKHKFIFHHCSEMEITMVKRLINNPVIPTAINHTLGVGAVIIKDNHILVIKDRIWKKYKLPGGYMMAS